MKIYAVSSGSYSDYSVDAIFSTQEKAQAWIDNETDQEQKSTEERLGKPIFYAGYQFNDIEEYELDPVNSTHVFKTCWRQDIELETGKLGRWPAKPRREKTNENTHSLSGFHNDTYAWADSYISAEHADKLCVEKRQEWLREKGITNVKTS